MIGGRQSEKHEDRATASRPGSFAPLPSREAAPASSEGRPMVPTSRPTILPTAGSDGFHNRRGAVNVCGPAGRVSGD